jgi:hypothetical protein
MKVTPILACLSPDHELTRMVVCPRICPRFQVSLYPTLSLLSGNVSRTEQLDSGI